MRSCWNCKKPGHLALNCPHPPSPEMLRAMQEQLGGHEENGVWCFRIKIDAGQEPEHEPEEEDQEDGYTTGFDQSDA
jgi:hypothetical protein